MGMDAAIIVREDSMKPQIIKGRALSVYSESGWLDISRKKGNVERGLTAEVPAVEDWGYGGHFDYRRDPGTGALCQWPLTETRETGAYSHNAHAHGNGRTNFFSVVHVESE